MNCFQNLVPLVSATTFEVRCITYPCCELLSEFSTFGISNNVADVRQNFSHVVNCFQNLVPLVSATTMIPIIIPCSCCELLSEFSTFGISNNNNVITGIYNLVVNCFQNLVPLVSATTRSIGS